MSTALKRPFFSWFEHLEAYLYLIPLSPAERRVVRAYQAFLADLKDCATITAEEYMRFQDLLNDTLSTFDEMGREAIAELFIPQKLHAMFKGALGGCQALGQKSVCDPSSVGLIPFYVHTCEVIVQDLWQNIQKKEIDRRFRIILFIWMLPSEACRLALAVILPFLLLITLLTFQMNTVHLLISGWKVLLLTCGSLLSLWWLIAKAIQLAAKQRVARMIADVEKRGRYSQILYNHVASALVVWHPYPKLWTILNDKYEQASPDFAHDEEMQS